jgi:hypothetical protein
LRECCAVDAGALSRERKKKNVRSAGTQHETKIATDTKSRKTTEISNLDDPTQNIIDFRI